MLNITYVEEQSREIPIASAKIKSSVDDDWSGYVEVERGYGGVYSLSITTSTDIESCTYFLDETAARNLVDAVNNILETEV